jgi:hypothetical protein
MKKSYIDEYNDLVDKKCNEKILLKKKNIKQNVMSSNLVFDKNLNAFITPKLLTEKQFMSSVKNLFKYLGQSIPAEPVLEDLYQKVFNLYSLEQFMEFSDLVQFGGFNNLTEAYNAFLKNNESQEVTEFRDDLTERSNNLLEEIEEQSFSQIYPPVGSERDYGFAASGKSQEMSITTRERAERERRGKEVMETPGRPISMANIYSAERGRPTETIINPMSEIYVPP